MQITISGVPPYDGTYQVDPPYSVREVRVFKRVGGILPNAFADAALAGDVDFLLSLAIIGLQRHGQTVVEDVLLDSELGKIMLEAGDEDEADALPPPQTSSGPERRRSESTGSSGTSGNDDGASQPEKNPNATGALDSGTGVTFDRVTSAI